VSGFVAWLGPVLADQSTRLAAKMPDYARTLAARYDIDMTDLMSRVEAAIRDLDPRQIVNQIFSTTGRAVGIATFIFSATTNALLGLALVVIYFFLFSWHFNKGLATLGAYVPKSRKQRIFAIVSRMDDAVADFFRGRLVIAIAVGIMLSVGWFLSGVPYWFFLGMLTGILNIVPYLAIVTWPVAVLLKYVDTISNGDAASTGLLAILIWPSVVYIVVQFFEGWILTPWIQSGQTDMSAATVLIVVFIGGALAGIWGMLFAIPVAACVKILVQELLLPPLRLWAASH
jgi:predicted PurR-regulated permease PerM